MDHEATVQPELPIMNWELLDPPSHKVGHAQKQSIIKWKWYICDWTQAGLKDANKLHGRCLNAYGSDSYYYAFYCQACLL